MTEQGRHPNIPTVCVYVWPPHTPHSPLWLCVCWCLCWKTQKLENTRQSAAIRTIHSFSLDCRHRNTLLEIQETSCCSAICTFSTWKALYLWRAIQSDQIKKPKPQSDIILSDVTLQEWKYQDQTLASWKLDVLKSDVFDVWPQKCFLIYLRPIVNVEFWGLPPGLLWWMACVEMEDNGSVWVMCIRVHCKPVQFLLTSLWWSTLRPLETKVNWSCTGMS